MPLPAGISLGVWSAVMVSLKLLVIKNMYLPYAVLLGGAVI